MKYRALLAGTALWLSATQAQAISIVPEPSETMVAVGQIIDIDLRIADLGPAGPPSIASFDISLLFDPAILGFHDVLFGDPDLGDQLDIFGSFYASSTGLGFVQMDGVSFDDPLDLDAFQADAFVLGTIQLEVLAEGIADLTLDLALLDDGLLPTPTDLIPTTTLGGSQIVATSNAPAPSAPWLIALGGATLFRVRRTKR